MKVYLTEAQLATIILEAMNVADIYRTYYTDIDQNLYNKVVQADPTFDGQKMGKYTKWLLGLVRRGGLTEGDLYEVTDMLGTFEKYKNRVEIKDVTRLRSLDDLYDVIKPFREGNQAKSKSEERRMLKAGAEKVYEDDKWLIIIPHTKEAAKLYGKGTKWCTAADNSNRFDYYNSDGPLYINIDKETGKKYQFHFESDQFMNEHNHRIHKPFPKTMGLTTGALGYYKSVITPLNYISLTLKPGVFFKYCGDFGLIRKQGEGYRVVDKNGKEGTEEYDDFVFYHYQKFGYLIKGTDIYKINNNGRIEFAGEAKAKGHVCKYIKDCSVVEYIFDNIRIKGEILYKGRTVLTGTEGCEYDNIEANPVNGAVFFHAGGYWVPFIVNGMREIELKKDDVEITNCTDFDYRDERGIYAEVELNCWSHTYKLYMDGNLKKTNNVFDEDAEYDPNEPDYSTIE